VVGPCGLEPQTSTVSKRRDYVLRITYKPLRTALARAITDKTEYIQVKLQVKKYSREHRLVAVRVADEDIQFSMT